ncbi:hypothetical protein ACTG23_13265 [Aeromonas enteropelogenes]|uniref:hypothetical protein n=1 Tax=Aeromonas enteropelogenes TaxID=29489 RepID=UPI003F796C76
MNDAIVSKLMAVKLAHCLWCLLWFYVMVIVALMDKNPVFTGIFEWWRYVGGMTGAPDGGK